MTTKEKLQLLVTAFVYNSRAYQNDVKLLVLKEGKSYKPDDLITDIFNYISKKEQDESKQKPKLLESMDEMIEAIDKLPIGKSFKFSGIDFIKLDNVEGGSLCITEKIWKYLPFDHNWKKDVNNNYKESDIKEFLEEYFPIPKEILVPMEIDCGHYGTHTSHVGLLSKEQYEKYQDIIPKMDWYWWLSSPIRSGACYAYYVSTDGSLSGSGASDSNGAVPACIFKSSISQSPSVDGK